MEPPAIRVLAPPDLDAFLALRREALEAHPLVFGASVDDDRGLDAVHMRGALADTERQAIFGGFEGDELVGMTGLLRGFRTKTRHKAQLWGMYVVPRARRRGLARALLSAAIERARAWPEAEVLSLSVTTAAGAAEQLYLSAGFRPWGREPRSLCWQGQLTDEIHLALELQGGGAPRLS